MWLSINSSIMLTNMPQGHYEVAQQSSPAMLNKGKRF